MVNMKAGIKYYHHGIFLGENEGVFHFDDHPDGVVASVSSIPEFTDHGRFKIIRYVYKN